MKPRVFVVQPIPEPGLEMLREYADVEVYPFTDQQISVDDLVGAAKRSDYIFPVFGTMVPEKVIAANPTLKGIVSGKSSPYVDTAACEKYGVELLSAPGTPDPDLASSVTRSTCDLTVAMILNLAYRVPEADHDTRYRGFRQELTMTWMGVGCNGKTVGLIGLGKIGAMMVPRLKASNMTVLYTKRTRLSPEEEGALGIEWRESKDEVLAESDFVATVCSYNESTHMIIGERELKLMKPTAYPVNTGRGQLIDQPALIKALQDGTIAGSGLDVYWNEPPVSHDPSVPKALLMMDNVIVTPHIGSATEGPRSAMSKRGAEAIIEHIKANAAVPA